MIINIEQLVPILVEHQITANQFLLMYLTHLKAFTEVYRLTNEGKSWTQEEIDDLIDRGLVHNFNSGDNLYLDQLVISDDFVTEVFGSREVERGREFWEAYPDFIRLDGKLCSARNYPQDRFFSDYYKKIGYDPILHYEVVKAVNWGKRNHMISMGLVKFFETAQWETLIKLMNAEQSEQRVLPGEREY